MMRASLDPLFKCCATLAQWACPKVVAIDVQAIEHHEQRRRRWHVGPSLPKQMKPRDKLVIEDRDLAVEDEARRR
jgi:hypothetical protein